MLVLMMTILSAFAMDLNAPDEAFSEEGAEATAGSCTDSCGGQSEDGCWCDEWCAYNGDCCDDKSAVCDAEPEPVTSAQGRAGASPPTAAGATTPAPSTATAATTRRTSATPTRCR